MRKPASIVLLAVGVAAFVLAAPALTAGAAEPQSGECSDTSVASIQGIYVLSQTKCTTGVVACPATSVNGCFFVAQLDGTAAAGLGASRGTLRITDADTGAHIDFFCSGPATRCFVIQPTSFQPAGTRFRVTCFYGAENFLIRPTVNCSAAFEPL